MEKFELSITKNWDNYSCLYMHVNTVALNIANILINKNILEKIKKPSTTLEEIHDILSNLYENSDKYKKVA